MLLLPLSVDILKLIEDRFSFGSNAWNSPKIPLIGGGCVALTPGLADREG